MTIEEVWESYREDILLAEEEFKKNLRSVAPAISAVGGHLLSSGGKRIRPVLVILSSRMFGYRGEKASILACGTESIHTASLLHDDIVDGALMRRGKPTAHSLWGHQIAVLVGDYLYANALRLINSLNSQWIMDAFTNATASMSEGELLQLSNKERTEKGDPCTSAEDYMSIITGKTAVLMSAACLGGAVIGNATAEEANALATFGLKFGMAFQIADDILDYTAEETLLGKNLGKDLDEGKVTLPLINLLQDASPGEAEHIRSIFKRSASAKDDLGYIMHLFGNYGSIEKSRERARSLLDEAKSELSRFRDSRERSALLAVTDYILTRKR